MNKYGKHNLCRLLADLQKKGPQPIIQSMMPVARGEGSRFGEDVIRITGSDEFVEAVLSRLADLIEIERSNTVRLDCSWSEIKGEKFKKGAGGNSVYLRMARRSSGDNDSPMAMAHRMTRVAY